MVLVAENDAPDVRLSGKGTLDKRQWTRGTAGGLNNPLHAFL